jgi:4-hydroxy-tetrahydrodipicolinate synthase
MGDLGKLLNSRVIPFLLALESETQYNAQIKLFYEFMKGYPVQADVKLIDLALRDLRNNTESARARRLLELGCQKIDAIYNENPQKAREIGQEIAKFAEKQGADGVIFTIPPYVLIPQEDAFLHLDTVMGATSLPCGIYNNPARLGVQVEPETIKRLSDRHANFVVDKEATDSVYQLVQVQRLTQGKVKIMCCDSPWYAIALPTLAVGGTGFANIGGNIIPEEAARYSRPWTSIEIVNKGRELYFKYFPLLQELYEVSNPVVIKAALNLLGLPGGYVRRPYQDYDGEGLKRLEKVMTELGIFEKYAVR